MLVNRQAERQSNFELLRIVAMLMIVSLHFVGNIGLDPIKEGTTVNTIWYWICSLGGSLGNNLFILISGYFSIKSEKIKINKILRFWFQVFSYSVVLYLLMAAYQQFFTHNYTFSWTDIRQTVFPLLFNQWWFASTYFVLMVLSPFINRMLIQLKQREHLGLLVFLFFIWSVVPMVFNVDYQYSKLSWFIFVYCLAGYLRLYCDNTLEQRKTIYTVTVCSALGLLIIYVISKIYADKYIFFDWILNAYSSMNKALVLVMALSVFILFKNMSFPNNRIVNVISSATFGVYLIHENQYVRQMLANHIYSRVGLENNLFIPYFIIVLIMIFVACAAIELLRKQLIEKRYEVLINNIAKQMCYMFHRSK